MQLMARRSMDELVRAARSLSDPTRVRVLHLLIQRECCVCEVMDVLEISQVNASRYCSSLKDAGFLRVRKEGRWKHYSVELERLAPPLRSLIEAVTRAAASDVVALDDRRRLKSARRHSNLSENQPSSQPQILMRDANY